MPTLDKVLLDIQVVLGTTTMPIHQVLRLGRGAIIELDSSEDDEVNILANNFPVAKVRSSSAETASRSRSRSSRRGLQIWAEACPARPARFVGAVERTRTSTGRPASTSS